MLSPPVEASFSLFGHLCGKYHQLPSLLPYIPGSLLAFRNPWDFRSFPIHRCSTCGQDNVATHFFLSRASWNWVHSEQGWALLPAGVKKVSHPHPVFPEHQEIQRLRYQALQGVQYIRLEHQWETKQKMLDCGYLSHPSFINSYLSFGPNPDTGTSDGATKLSSPPFLHPHSWVLIAVKGLASPSVFLILHCVSNHSTQILCIRQHQAAIVLFSLHSFICLFSI